MFFWISLISWQKFNLYDKSKLTTEQESLHNKFDSSNHIMSQQYILQVAAQTEDILKFVHFVSIVGAD